MKIAFDELRVLIGDGIEDLLQAHWSEVALDQDRVPLAVDWDSYFTLERQGMLKVISVRDPDGALVGYSWFFYRPHLHYKTTLHATNDIIYLDPALRGGGHGARLVRESEAMLKALAPDRVLKVMYHVKLDVLLGHKDSSATVGTLLAHLGYAHAENCYSRVI